MSSVFEAGLLGEWRAARYLTKRGMKVLARRFRTHAGEIDLVCRDGDTVVFVEVKARAKGRLGDGLQAIDGKKRRRMQNAAQIYLAKRPAASFRFDAVEITAAGIRHIPHIF